SISFIHCNASFAAMVTLLEICRSKNLLSWFLRVVHLYVSCRFHSCSQSLLPLSSPVAARGRVNANNPSISSILHVPRPPLPALHSKSIISSVQATPTGRRVQ
ncbi:hypothetical protein BDR07DRAFT_1430679, partial [Suillus spraguei]